jgi:hypothetical protein
MVTPVAHVYRYWVDPMYLTKIFKYRYLRMLEVLEKRGEQTVDEYYRCSAASVEQCMSVYVGLFSARQRIACA